MFYFTICVAEQIACTVEFEANGVRSKIVQTCPSTLACFLPSDGELKQYVSDSLNIAPSSVTGSVCFLNISSTIGLS